MAEFNRSLSTPVEARSRSRNNHPSCPRCRVDPSHISRQFWEATTRHHQDLSNNNNFETRPVVVGYPDLCRRSSRSYTSPASVHQYQHHQQRSVPVASTTANTTTGYYTLANNAGQFRYSSDTHSTRSAGDTWRIRGILENHQPDVTRRAESSMGRLPDVTHHSTLPIQHARTRSVPVGGAYDSRLPSNSSYDIRLQQNPPPQVVSRSSTQGILCASRNQDTATLPLSGTRHQGHRPEPVPSTSTLNPQWKREQHHHPPTHSSNSNNPWVTMDRQTRSATLDRPSSSHNHTHNSLNWSNQQQQTNTNNNSNNNNNNNNIGASSSSNCWRPSTVTSPTQGALNPCPLPDLVTPRRQVRKQCCGLLATHSVAIRWLVVIIAVLGLLCSIIGTIVGVVKATGREHLTVALLLIGLGIVLVSMSGVAWRLTSRESPSCRAMFGLRRARHEPHRRFVPRVPHYGRPHPFSAMLYPDITLRPPPPSYQASMQEYRLRLLLMDRQSPPHPPPPQPPPPPPPMYRGPATVYPRFPVNIGISDYSRPPSYRSRPSSAGQPSPVGQEDLELINNSTSSSHHLPSDVISPASASLSSSARTPASSVGNTNNHVEVVAQV